MASRMDRYKEESRTTGRSDRNKSLYKQIEDLDSYTNIAGIATIENNWKKIYYNEDTKYIIYENMEK